MDDPSVVDHFNLRDWIIGCQRDLKLDVDRSILGEAEHFAWEIAIGGRPKQRSVRDKAASPGQCIEPGISAEFPVAELNIAPVVADWIGEHSGGTPGGGGDSQTGIQGVVVDLLSPVAVADWIRQPRDVARAAPGFVLVHPAAAHVVVGEADRVHLVPRPARSARPTRMVSRCRSRHSGFAHEPAERTASAREPRATSLSGRADRPIRSTAAPRPRVHPHPRAVDKPDGRRT